MNNLVRLLIVSAVCLLLAIFLGYKLATPDTFETIGIVGLILTALCFPLVLKWHYPFLLFSWNASILVFFLPGQAQLWMLMALVSLFVSVMAYTLNRKVGFQTVPSVNWTLAFLLFVILVTAKFRGGIGLYSLGGTETIGGRNYFYILFAAAGYFAISCQRIPEERANRYVAIFFVGAITAAISNLVYFAGDSFYWLYWIFPWNTAGLQIGADYSGSELVRFAGFSFASTGVFSFLLARYGIRGLLDFHKWWRLVIFLTIIGLGLLGGFRSTLIVFVLVFAIQFCLEGLWRTHHLFVILAVGSALFTMSFFLLPKAPLSLQRSFSWLPVDVDPSVQYDAMGSAEWRLKMWQTLLPEVPKYFLFGKGYAISETDLFLAQEAQKRGLAQDYEFAMIAGDYHSGPLSLLIPFGIFGTLGFIIFSFAAMRVLYKNYKYGAKSLHSVNALLFAAFVAKFIFFWLIFGFLPSDLPVFAGFVGLSVALNGGVKRRGEARVIEPVPVAA